MDTKTLRDDPIVQDFLIGIEAKKNTKFNYLRGLQHYTNMTGLTPLELINEAEAEIEAGVLMRKRQIKSHLLRFKEYLEEHGYAPSSRKSWTAAVHSFYQSHDIDLPRMKMKGIQPLQKNKKPLPTRDDIRSMLAHATPRMRAMILLLVSSGMAQAEMRHLTVAQFMQRIDEDTGVATLNVRREKVNWDYITFCSPEAVVAITTYIADRERRLKRKLAPDEMVFATRSGKPTAARDITRAFQKIAEQADIKNEPGTFNAVRPHALRKYFNSMLLNNGASIFFTDFLMGHKIDSTRAAYYFADPVKLKQKYLKYLPFLSIESVETKTIESMEYAELKKELDELKARENDRRPVDDVMAVISQKHPKEWGIIESIVKKIAKDV